jgi:hypothetical protein
MARPRICSVVQISCVKKVLFKFVIISFKKNIFANHIIVSNSHTIVYTNTFIVDTKLHAKILNSLQTT